MLIFGKPSAVAKARKLGRQRLRLGGYGTLIPKWTHVNTNSRIVHRPKQSRVFLNSNCLSGNQYCICFGVHGYDYDYDNGFYIPTKLIACHFYISFEPDRLSPFSRWCMQELEDSILHGRTLEMQHTSRTNSSISIFLKSSLFNHPRKITTTSYHNYKMVDVARSRHLEVASLSVIDEIFQQDLVEANLPHC